MRVSPKTPSVEPLPKRPAPASEKPKAVQGEVSTGRSASSSQQDSFEVRQGDPPPPTDPALAEETEKLKRMIESRSQMFDMLRQIMDKYNQTARGIIDKIGS